MSEMKISKGLINMLNLNKDKGSASLISNQSLLIDEQGNVSVYALMKGFIQKEELILEEEKKLSIDIYQSKKLVSVALIYEAKQFIVYYINDAINIRKCRELDDINQARAVYEEFKQEMKRADWSNIYWKKQISYLN